MTTRALTVRMSAETPPAIRTFSIDYIAEGDADGVTMGDFFDDVQELLADKYGLVIEGGCDGPYAELVAL